MVKVFGILVCLSFASKVLEYRPNVSCVQSLTDYSGNGRTGVNGQSSTDPYYDALCTSKGAYFTGSETILSPPNDLVSSSVTLSNLYSVILWVYPFSYYGFLYLDFNSQTYDYIYLYTYDGNGIEVGLSIGGQFPWNDVWTLSNSTLYTADWSLVVLLFNSKTATLLINDVTQFSISLSSNFAESPTFQKSIGYYGQSFSGFLWYMAIVTGITSYTSYYSSSSSTCLSGTGTCTLPCSPAFVDPYSGKGCVSVNTDPCSSTAYSTGLACAACASPCVSCTSSTVCTSCLASNASPDGTGTCQCNSGYYGTTPLLTSSACSACVVPCSTCTSLSVCTACVATNASPNANGVCTCASGYYGTAPLTSTNSCSSCVSPCVTCSSATVCTGCISSNSYLDSNGICQCDSGYYGTLPLTTVGACSICLTPCSTCTSLSVCTACVAANASPNGQGVCQCSSGYYGTAPLTSSGACSACVSPCATCSSLSVCLSCVASNASPDGLGACQCNSGYYQTSALTSASACSACASSCVTCSSANFCLSCIASNASPSGQGVCQCTSGYYGTQPLDYANSCSICVSPCTSCTSLSVCTGCLASYTYVDSNGVCQCNSGYFGTLPLTSLSSCTLCVSPCITCISLSTCTSCVTTNATPDGSGVCRCDSGFYGTVPLLASNSCSSCVTPCSTCSSLTFCNSCAASNATPDSSGICRCNSGYYGSVPLTTINGCSLCISPCATCSNLNTCLSCVASNATPNSQGVCQCNSYYYGTPPLTAANSCALCLTPCTTCTSLSFCTGCVAFNSAPTALGLCQCNLGYYGTSPLTASTSCHLCVTPCTTCTSLSVCTACFSSNASPSSAGTCQCNSGYYGTPPLVSANACLLCVSPCSTCTSRSFCLSCVASHATADAQGICRCNAYYYGVLPLTATSSCSPCQAPCSTCTSISFCTSCLAPHAGPDAMGVCRCSTGYFGSLPLLSTSSCTACYLECATCIQENLCESCVAAYGVPTSPRGCICRSGTFGNAPLSSSWACIECYVECETCAEANQCVTCKDSNALPDLESNVGCACNGGYWKDGTVCVACAGSCLTCFGPYDYQCSSCVEYYFYGYCINECPLGYIGNMEDCFVIQMNELAMQYTFDGYEYVYYDKINGIPAEIQSLNNSELLPKTAYNRGIYFYGGGYLRTRPIGIAMFSPKFSISLWIKPNVTDGAILYRGSATFKIFSISMEGSFIVYALSIESRTYFFYSANPVALDEWNHVFLTVNYSEYTTMQVRVNNYNTEMNNLMAAAYLDTEMMDLFIGYGLLMESKYVGFLYRIELFIPSAEVEDVISSNCDACYLCPGDGICINNCEIDSFYSESYKECTKCSSNCPSGCLNSTECNLCADLHCDYCSSYLPNSCIGCFNDYIVENSTCALCPPTTYYSPINQTCLNCQGLCLQCTTASSCIFCIENSSLDYNSTCTCDLGYTGTESCTRNTFTAAPGLYPNNTIKLIFSEPLFTALDETNTQLVIAGLNYSFNQSMLETNICLVTLTSFTVNSENVTVGIYFSEGVVSAMNSLLATRHLELKLFYYPETVKEIKIREEANIAKNNAKGGMLIGVIITLGVSLLKLDPAPFFNFLNTVELLYSAYLYNIELYPVLSDFLLGMRFDSYLPNLFTYLISPDKGSKVPDKLASYGYKSNLILLNVGGRISVVLLLLFSSLFIFLLNINKGLRPRMAPLIKRLKYALFLRLWIQFFFELLEGCVLALLHYELSASVQCVDIAVTSLILVIFIQFIDASGIVLLVYLIYKREKIVDEEEITKFTSYFSTFFGEINNKGPSSWVFYLLFVVRRVLLVIVINFIEEGVLQVIVVFVISLCVMVI